MKTIMMVLFFVSAVTVHAATYSGSFQFLQNDMHDEDVKGTIQFTLDNNQLTKVFVKTEVPVMGISEFTSTEQTVVSCTAESMLQSAFIYKLKGPTHKWYYVFLATSSDAGTTYAGTFFKGPKSIDDIKQALNQCPSNPAWKKSGQGSVTLVQ